MKTRLRRDIGYANVRMDPRWQSFDEFFKDMGECPPGHTLDRKDPHGHYEPLNCRWLPKSEQSKTTKRYLAIGLCRDCNENRGNRAGRCHRCCEYFRRNGESRPTGEELEKRQIARKEAIKKAICKPVDQFTLEGEFVKTWPSAAEACRALNVGKTMVNHAISGRCKTCRGFIWRFSSTSNLPIPPLPK